MLQWAGWPAKANGTMSASPTDSDESEQARSQAHRKPINRRARSPRSFPARSPRSRHQTAMQNRYLGLLLAIIGNSLIGLSFSTVKYAHENNPNKLNYLRLKWWWIGTTLMGLGELGNLLAYAVAKPALISPLGAISVVVNAPTAYFVLGEKLETKNAIGGLLCILGGVGIVHVVAGQKSDSHFISAADFEVLCTNPAFLVYLLVTLVESLELIISKRKSIVVYVLICSFLGAVTVLSIKGLSSFIFLTLQGENQFWHPLPWLLFPSLGVAVSFQIHYLNMSMAEYGTGEVVPVYYVLFTASAVFGSAMLYSLGTLVGYWGFGIASPGLGHIRPMSHFRDLDNTSMSDAFVFLLSLGCTSIGVYLVARRKDTPPQSAGHVDALPLIGNLGDGPAERPGYSHIGSLSHEEEVELA